MAESIGRYPFTSGISRGIVNSYFLRFGPDRRRIVSHLWSRRFYCRLRSSRGKVVDRINWITGIWGFWNTPSHFFVSIVYLVGMTSPYSLPHLYSVRHFTHLLKYNSWEPLRFTSNILHKHILSTVVVAMPVGFQRECRPVALTCLTSCEYVISRTVPTESNQ